MSVMPSAHAARMVGSRWLSGATKYVVAFFLLILPLLTFGQSDFPTRPLRIIVPFPAGGSNDTLARQVGQALHRLLGKPVVIDNRPGAAGNIGAEIVVKATADGYTLLWGGKSIVTMNPWLYRNMSFDPLKQLVPVVQIGSGGTALIAHVGAPFAGLTEFVDYARHNPKRVNYGSYGTGSYPHLYMEVLKDLAGFDVTHVPYRGSPPAITDLIAGRIGVMFDGILNILQPYRAGRVRVLAVVRTGRHPLIPDAPNLAEHFPGFRFRSWQGVLAPTDTPPVILDRLHGLFNAALREPDVQDRMRDFHFVPSTLDRKNFADEIAAEALVWRGVIRRLGLSLD